MKKRIVISGAGALSAHGHTIDAICAREAAPVPVDNRIPLNGGLSLLPVLGLDTNAVSGRLKRKLDPFAVYGLCAAGMALTSSRLLDSDIDKERIGIFVGNCLGGWCFTEPELQKLHTIGVDAMSPYVATAWFPAALQGQISLQHEFKGYSKTYSAAGVAGMQAIGYAVEAIQHGRADVIVCGASEDLSSPYARAILRAYDYGSDGRKSIFGKEKGVDFAEGAAFVVIESYEHAKQRGAPIYCEITGFADHFCARPADRNAILKKNLAAAIGCGNSKHLLVLDGLFEEEAAFTDRTLMEMDTPISVTNSKAALGNMFAASGVMELACVAHDLRSGAAQASRLEGRGAASTGSFENVVLRRLGKHGGVATLSVSAV